MRSRERKQKPEPGSGWYRIRVKTSNTLRYVPQLVRGPDYFTEGHKVNLFIHSFLHLTHTWGLIRYQAADNQKRTDQIVFLFPMRPRSWR